MVTKTGDETAARFSKACAVASIAVRVARLPADDRRLSEKVWLLK